MRTLRWPFGRIVVRKPTAGTGSAIGNVIWFVLAGLWIAIGHVLTAIPLRQGGRRRERPPRRRLHPLVTQLS